MEVVLPNVCGAFYKVSTELWNITIRLFHVRVFYNVLCQNRLRNVKYWSVKFCYAVLSGGVL